MYTFNRTPFFADNLDNAAKYMRKRVQVIEFDFVT